MNIHKNRQKATTVFIIDMAFRLYIKKHSQSLLNSRKKKKITKGSWKKGYFY